ncbi:hypothetical protein [environmental halophage 1 AAJ-2005]|nr:hypothetical protein [environmental halophage 1 AAJ-2005]
MKRVNTLRILLFVAVICVALVTQTVLTPASLGATDMGPPDSQDPVAGGNETETAIQTESQRNQDTKRAGQRANQTETSETTPHDAYQRQITQLRHLSEVDSDGDGLVDAQELFTYETDPNSKYTDADSLPDEREVQLQTDPTQTNTDGDGLTDGLELSHGTDPLSPHSDADTLTDGGEIATDTNPLVADTDSDNLDDGIEIQVESSPTNPDTDADGFHDGAELKYDSLENASPTQKDIFIEIDSTPTVSLPEEDIQRLEQTFESAPVDGGIELHIIMGDQSVKIPPTGNLTRYFGQYLESEFDHQGRGYHHVTIVSEIDFGKPKYNLAGLARSQTSDGMLVKAKPHGGTGSVLLHELGHHIGLSNHGVFDGIDSSTYSSEEYPSVMNYNRNAETEYSYSGGPHSSTEFDDWARIEQSLNQTQASQENFPIRVQYEATDNPR